MATGLGLMAAFASVSGGYWSVLPGLLVLGVGVGLAQTPATSAITGSLPQEEQGVASALNDTVRPTTRSCPSPAAPSSTA